MMISEDLRLTFRRQEFDPSVKESAAWALGYIVGKPRDEQMVPKHSEMDVKVDVDAQI